MFWEVKRPKVLINKGFSAVVAPWTIVYSTEDEWEEYQQYVRYLVRDGLIDCPIEFGNVAPLQGVTGLKFARVRVLPALGNTPSV